MKTYMSTTSIYKESCRFGGIRLAHRLFMKSYSLFLLIPLVALSACGLQEPDYLEQALQLAGDNRGELEKVLDHYKDSTTKLAAARFLIENMPAHNSYRGDEIDEYYSIAKRVFRSKLTPKQQADSMAYLAKYVFPDLKSNIISDVEIMTSDFLIQNIEKAFIEWETRPWAAHLTFEQFCEWLLPYKVANLQSLDAWRDTLSSYFTWGLNNMVRDDDTYETTVNAANTIRNEINWRIRPFGIYFSEKGYPFLSASTMPYFTFGNCRDYVTVAVSTFRSVGIPSVIDETPYWGRYRAGHNWYTILNNRGEELTSEWDVSSTPGKAFFTDKRIPKVFRNTYSINRERQKYLNTSLYKHPFGVCQKDVTDKYFNTSDLEIPVFEDFRPVEEYVYIATFTAIGSDWSIVDYGYLKDGKAHFSKMGRNVLYIAMGYDGRNLRPISRPFILHTNGNLEYIVADKTQKRSIVARRKYYQSKNVATMRKRILHGQIQCANKRDFTDAVTLFTIDDVLIPDKIALQADKAYRYWRYLSPAGSYGNIAELHFFNGKDSVVRGRVISNIEDKKIANRAFDNNWLTNVDCELPDENWVGMDMGRGVHVSSVRIVPRSDDNDIHPGDTYELRYWNEDNAWTSCGKKVAESNLLCYDSIPKGALMWISNCTRGYDERPFLIDGEGTVGWW